MLLAARSIPTDTNYVLFLVISVLQERASACLLKARWIIPITQSTERLLVWLDKKLTNQTLGLFWFFRQISVFYYFFSCTRFSPCSHILFFLRNILKYVHALIFLRIMFDSSWKSTIESRWENKLKFRRQFRSWEQKGPITCCTITS